MCGISRNQLFHITFSCRFGATLAHGVDFMRGRGLVTAVLGETIPKQFCRKVPAMFATWSCDLVVVANLTGAYS